MRRLKFGSRRSRGVRDAEFSPMNPAASQAPEPARLQSLDALRGFDMIWIIGAEAVGGAAGKLGGGPGFRAFSAQFDHVDWVGFHFYDLIFPLFVFMIGISITLSIRRIVERQGCARALRRVFRRALLLYVLGLLYYGGLDGPVSHIRLMGVLQRLGLCYLFTSLLFIYLRPRALIAVFVAILVGYWALLRFVPVPGFGPGDFSEGHNLTNWIDQHFLPGRKWDGDHDPEGLLSTLPAVATCLLGVFSGLLIQDQDRTGKRKAALLACTGAAVLAAGSLWGLEFPVIKKIWTSSYVLVAGGWSMILLSLFYLVIDVWRVRSWSMPLVWIGANALAIYLITNVADFWKLSSRFVGGDVGAWLDNRWAGLSGLATGCICVGLCAAVCHFLYKRGIFLRL
jgi:predicted acyltransferase